MSDLLDAARRGLIRLQQFMTLRRRMAYVAPLNDVVSAELAEDERLIGSAIAAAEQRGDGGGWKNIEDAPRDGTPIGACEFYRWKAYKPGAPKHLLKLGGRWQRWSGYGWENAQPPELWLTGAVMKQEGRGDG